MARIRTVKPKFWDDSKLSKVSRDARLLFIGMWNFSDDLGVIISDPIWIKSKIFPYDNLDKNQLQNWVNELLDNKFIVLLVHNSENFYFIRNFDKHQRINKPNNEDLYIAKDCLSAILEESRNNHGLITEQSRNNQVSITGGEERKGEERKGRGEDSPTEKFGGDKFLNSFLIYDAEKEILKNQIFFEEICVSVGTNLQLARDSLRKYHLHLEEKEQYPKPKKAIFAGFEKWLLNEKKFTKNDKSGGNKSVGKTIEFDKA